MRYLAYGSNMFFQRLSGRVHSALFLGAARLPGYSLRWHKKSKDGSGKCSLAPAEDGLVYGALFAIPIAEEARLAAAEGSGYRKVTVQVETDSGSLSAETFIAEPENVDETLRPFTWYRDLVVAGAVQAELPSEYVQSLKDVQARDDADTKRDARERSILPPDLEKAGKGKEYLESLWDDPYDRLTQRTATLEEKIGWLRPIVILGGLATAIWLVFAALGAGFWTGFLAIFVVLGAFKFGFAPLFALSSIGLVILHRLPAGVGLGAVIMAALLLYADVRSWPVRRSKTGARTTGGG
jgi:hypothetical protein